MKRFLHIFTALLVIASCTRELEGTDVCEPAIDLGITFSTKAAGNGSGSGSTQEPVINSMRVLIFYGNPSGSEIQGNLLFNTFYAFGFNTARETDRFVVNLANQIVLPKSDCRDYNIYVVLNEEGFSLSGATPADLHATLGDFAGNETALRNILSTPAVYTEVLKNVDEPAFLISGCKAVTFGSGELGSGKHVTVDGDAGFNRGRSMAQIVVKEITSEPADGIDYTSTEVPLIFVKSVTLENIPNTIAWSDGDGATDGTAATKMASQQVGSANSDGYYTRSWYGHITRTISNLYAQKVQYTDAKFYRTGNNADNDAGKIAWSFNVKPYRTTDGAPGPGTAPYTYIYAQGDEVTPQLSNAQKLEDAINGLKVWAKGNNASKHSTQVLENQISGVFDALQDDNEEMSENISYTSYEVTGVAAAYNIKEDKKAGTIDTLTYKTTIGPATLTDDYWTVRLGDKFYVPENIQNATTSATCLHVTLAIAEPKFSFSLNKVDKIDERVCTEDMNTEAKVGKGDYKAGYNYVDPTTLPSPSKLMDDESGLTYTYYVGDSETGNLKQISEIEADWVKKYGSIAWADDENHVLDPTSYRTYDKNGDFKEFNKNFQDSHGQFNTYIDGFNRRTENVQTGIVVNETLKGSHFDWNVNAATHVYDFVIPVNNNIGNDGDYSVRRNTRYTLTLYVNQGTYDSLATKADASCPFTLTAKVNTETVSCDEE